MKFRNRVTVALVATLVLGVGAWIRAAQTPPTQCSVDSLGTIGLFDAGWIHKSATGFYRCMPTFDGGLRPNGAAWVRANADGTIGAALPQ